MFLNSKRLLEKKNARKRKQEEAAAALKNINLSSDVKKSPIKSRNPLVERNEVATRDFHKLEQANYYCRAPFYDIPNIWPISGDSPDQMSSTSSSSCYHNHIFCQIDIQRK